MKTILNDKNGEPVIWWNWQNLTKENGRRKGRAWLFFGNNRANIEWALNPKRLAIGADFADEACADDNLLVYFSIPYLISLYFSVSRLPIVTKLPGVKWQSGDHYSGERSIEFYYNPHNENHMHWRLWRNPHISNSRDWRDDGLFVDDLIFGREKYTKEGRETRSITIDMPEGTYEATAKLFTATWTRKRWRKPRTNNRVEIEIPKGIPHPGHGENSWDQDDDATYAITTNANTIEEAIENLKASVMRERLKYGGEDWKPTAD